jgi:hypothetical protein
MRLLVLNGTELQQALFGYEKGRGQADPIWQNPWWFEGFGATQGNSWWQAWDEWLASTRHFTRDEVLSGRWRKDGDHGYSHYLTFHGDGRVSEQDVADAGYRQEGHWQLEQDGIALRIRILDYDLVFFAKKTGSVHSGVEQRSSDASHRVYFRLYRA